MNLTLSEKYIGKLNALGYKEIASYLEYAIDEIRATERQVEILTDTTTKTNDTIIGLNNRISWQKKELSRHKREIGRLMLDNNDLVITITSQLEEIKELKGDK